jgi:oxygen-independent coproporphyrinogen-3 oxidase
MPGLYVHIPFCVRKCRYCDFVSFPDPDGIGDYLVALETEIRMRPQEEAGMPEAFDTVFLGGGTPSLLSGAQMERLMDRLRSSYRIRPDAEITVECNPGTADREKLAAYAGSGINRLSVGLQSASDALLARIGRIHRKADFLRCMEDAEAAGLVNRSADVMHGLPGQTLDDYLETLETAVGCGITHLSSYALILEEGTPLYADVRSGRETVPDEDETADMEDAGLELLERQGFERYEISNFARPGYACRHNIGYWENGPYLGLGIAAHSSLRRGGRMVRTANRKDRAGYLACLREGRLPFETEEEIPAREEMLETVMVGLRMTAGISLAGFRERFGMDLMKAYPDSVRELARKGWARRTEERFFLTKEGLDLQNRALGYFFLESDRN